MPEALCSLQAFQIFFGISLNVSSQPIANLCGFVGFVFTGQIFGNNSFG